MVVSLHLDARAKALERFECGRCANGHTSSDTERLPSGSKLGSGDAAPCEGARFSRMVLRS